MPSESLPDGEGAQAALGNALYSYLLGRAEDQIGSGDRNVAEFSRYALVPRLLGAASPVDLSTSFAGRAVSAPLIVGAFAADRIFHSEGLLPVARSCHRLGLAHVVSEETVTPLEEITALNQETWLQLRAAGPVERIAKVIEAAKGSGVAGIVMTLLAPTHPRPVQRPGGYDIGAELRRRNWTTIGTQLDGSNASGPTPLPTYPRWGLVEVSEVAQHCLALHLPLIIKGVLHTEDAAQLLQAHVDALMVSNVGLRQSGRWVTPLEQLPKIAAQTPGAVLLLDGGVRHPADVLISRILGATCAVVTRPVLTALAGGGEGAVDAWLSRMIDGLHAMACWMGAATLDDLRAGQLVRT